jgi:hypothetical protein
MSHFSFVRRHRAQGTRLRDEVITWSILFPAPRALTRILTP